MKKLLLIYNPFSGNHSFKDNLDKVVDILQNKGNFNVMVYRMSRKVSIIDFLESIDYRSIDTVCISGGDGTINIVINELTKLNFFPKIGLFPSGTANDFCSNLGYTKNPVQCANIIAKGKIEDVDYGKVNDRYFINVICIGLFAEVSQGVDPDLKASFGRFAYFLRGAQVLTNVNPLNVKITTSDNVYEETTYLILILNGDRAGGIKLAPLSTMNDGTFDLVLFKAVSYPSATAALLKVLNGNHINDESVIYLQSDSFKIECENESCDTDIDGEKGPSLPLDIQVMKNKLQIYVK